jgi:hypothetical protein
MPITNAANTIDLRYAASAKALAAHKALEALNLTSNPGEIADAEAACAAASVAFAAAGASAIATGSNIRVVQSGVEFLAPAITGSYVNGYTLTIANGVVTAIAAS